MVLLSRKIYIVAVAVIGLSYLVHRYSAMAQYDLAHTPRMRRYLYRDYPICYAIVFAASFLPEGWRLIIFLIVMAYLMVVGIKVGRQAIKSYYQH